MTKDLTEVWKNGELEEGEYYVKLESGKIDIYFMVYDDDDCDEIVEIIAPVPSYEEWQQMKAFCEEFNALKVAEENAKLNEHIEKLEELLKECREWVEFMEEKSRADENYKGTMYFKNLLTKIDEVLK